jgi:adenine-specific DNA glycosylase
LAEGLVKRAAEVEIGEGDDSTEGADDGDGNGSATSQVDSSGNRRVNQCGDFNQAMMELGATLCTTAAPRCGVCPLNTHCTAYKQQQQWQKRGKVGVKGCASGDNSIDGSGGGAATSGKLVTDYPLKAVKKKPTDESLAVCVVECAAGAAVDAAMYLMVRRPESGLLAGQWEFLCAKLEGPTMDGASKAAKKVGKGKKVGKRKKGAEVEQPEVKGAKEALCLYPEYPVAMAAIDKHATRQLQLRWEMDLPLPMDSVASGGSAVAESANSKLTRVRNAAIKVESEKAGAGEIGDVRVTRESVGTLTHVFSHRRHHMRVEVIRLPRASMLLVADLDDSDSSGSQGSGGVGLRVASGAGGQQVAWLTEKQMQEVGLTTGMKKVLELTKKMKMKKEEEGKKNDGGAGGAGSGSMKRKSVQENEKRGEKKGKAAKSIVNTSPAKTTTKRGAGAEEVKGKAGERGSSAKETNPFMGYFKAG